MQVLYRFIFYTNIKNCCQKLNCMCLFLLRTEGRYYMILYVCTYILGITEIYLVKNIYYI